MTMENPVFMEKIGRIFYNLPDPPPRVRKEPMQVLCVGFPRSGTESLQTALLKLGYDYTYHGWDILFETPTRAQVLSRLAHKKWFGAPDGDVHITAAEFDEVIGHCTAVTDAVGSCFATELIEAYPDAKVVLNVRRDLDAWHKSAITTLSSIERDWWIYLQTWFSAEYFWSWHIYERLLWPRLFRSPSTSLSAGLVPNGKWVYREHCAMVRGIVPGQRLLEWSVEDGWEPLCKFLGKEIPKEDFPNTNNPAAFQDTVGKIMELRTARVHRNMGISAAVLVGVSSLIWLALTRI